MVKNNTLHRKVSAPSLDFEDFDCVKGCHCCTSVATPTVQKNIFNLDAAPFELSDTVSKSRDGGGVISYYKAQDIWLRGGRAQKSFQVIPKERQLTKIQVFSVTKVVTQRFTSTTVWLRVQ